ncbi:MAG: ABC transporter ATP-binding protein [Bacteroidetes bacterium]|nr:ABC transporter ATP-binding protein [Bacteroidota bacterium]
MIELNNISKSYQITKNNSLKVLKGIDLNINRSEIAAIVGKSGAGKSTLLHIIGTLDKPDTGSMTFEESDIFAMNDKQIASFRAKDVGFIFQFHHLLPEFTALENVQIAARIAGSTDEDKAKELLAEVGLGDRMHHKPSELSGGEAQRVAIARALVNSPAIVLADEPTGNLDSENADAVIDLIFTLRKKFGQTFVIVTHNEEFAAKCDRIIKMTDGMITG